MPRKYQNGKLEIRRDVSRPYCTSCESRFRSSGRMVGN